MKIQVLGSGCQTCKKLNDLTTQAVKELGLSDQVEYLVGQEGLAKIIGMGLMQSPVLSIDDTPVMVGFTPDIEKIKNLIQKAKK
ncbi:MAG TPA: thioredoxin family protein [Patescibacteria group bacterium]|nr:thioredoxin family protein [Patescibacteria group bacterium]